MDSSIPDDERAAEGLAAALEALLTAYPTDLPDAARTTVAVAAPTGLTHYIRATPGQVAWLTRLLANESATCDNAHPGGSGACAHCEGSGTVGPRWRDFEPQA